jgi:hypothetical protein
VDFSPVVWCSENVNEIPTYVCVGLKHALHLILSENADFSPLLCRACGQWAVGSASTINKLKKVLVR